MAQQRMEWMNISVRMAGEWLDKLAEANKKADKPQYRNPSQPAAEGIARDIKADEWHKNAGVISINSAGIVIDGQTRLLGIVLSGIAVYSWVCFNVETAMGHGNGRPRRLSDYLRYMGYKNYFVLGAATKLIWDYEHDNMWSGGKRRIATESELLSMIEKRPRLAKESLKATSAIRKLTSGTIPTLIWHQGSKLYTDETITEFLGAVGNGVSLEAGDPRLVMRRCYLDNQKAGSKERVSKLQLCARFIKAWNFYVIGDFPITLRRLKWNPGDPFPKFTGTK